MKKHNFEYVNGMITYIEIFKYVPKNSWFCHYRVDGESEKEAPASYFDLSYPEFISFFNVTFGLDIPDNPDKLILNFDDEVDNWEYIIPYKYYDFE